MPPSGPLASHLLTALDRAYQRQSWHGTNLRGSLRGVSASKAAARPAPGRHNIWELTVHCAYWKYAVWRRLTGGKRRTFPLQGSNWFERPLKAQTDHKAWRADLELLDHMHRALRLAVTALGQRDLTQPVRGGKITAADLIAGVTAHDLYHAGQIQLIKRLT